VYVNTCLGLVHLTYYCNLDAKYGKLKSFQRWCWQQCKGCSKEMRIWMLEGHQCDFFSILAKTSWKHIEIVVCPFNPKYVSIV
jgi:hypothetical protein